MGGRQSQLPTRMWASSREDSEDLAMRIRNYWAVRGYKVQTEVLALSDLGEAYPALGHAYSIRSNMVGGYPPRDPNEPVKVPAPKPRTATQPHAMVRT